MQLKSISKVLDYLHEKKKQTTIETMLRMSCLPQKNQKTFDNFDFSVIKSRDVDKLRALPSLSAIYAHRNLAFIGPAGSVRLIWHRHSVMNAVKRPQV